MRVAVRVLALTLLFTADVRAQNAIAEGRKAFEQANQELNLGHFERALELMETSYRLTSKPELLYNLGYVNRQLFYRTRELARLEKAIDLYTAFLENAQRAAPGSDVRRSRAEQELKGAQDELVKERAARAHGEQALVLGEELVQKGMLDEAAEQLSRFSKLPGRERPAVVRGLMLRAAIAAARGDSGAASAACAKALALDPAATPAQGAAEPLRRACTRAQLRLGGAGAVQVSHTPPGSLRAGQPVELSFGSTPDPAGVVKGIVISYRAGRGAFSSLPEQAVGRISLPRPFTQGLLPDARVEYYGDVRDEDGAVLQHLGTASLPFAVQTDKQPPKSVAKKWWFWTVMGGVAAAAAVGIGLGVHYGTPHFMEVPIYTGLSGP